jgi:hypothetical protein
MAAAALTRQGHGAAGGLCVHPLQQSSLIMCHIWQTVHRPTSHQSPLPMRGAAGGIRCAHVDYNLMGLVVSAAGTAAQQHTHDSHDMAIGTNNYATTTNIHRLTISMAPADYCSNRSEVP